MGARPNPFFLHPTTKYKDTRSVQDHAHAEHTFKSVTWHMHYCLQNLFERDPEFQAQCLMVLPEAAELQVSTVGSYLATRLEKLGLGEQQKSWVD